ncbi:hypothetical protein ABB37_04171 [Leptomonas pyrrhocoris]|uniref:Uncharacterized protein n=1 Tax=Leptomonas pyrrhocoris TaxID=157538 RepID=A0A0M9G4G8_LEPPY|nr:hypothetical protein ABB37_04171 [Leptomonas pyrrhocoris]XP_015660378.1 hypothetical protein ABB37_04171 [Leptomonas pyrrhocoris]KPA81938.1 hypothetical protein ABB37_04171 [Leptomonas pyrrhocoris]KPA81939.1 hypothetical protein ABB37_04171 [Leptomonas pyrrhocoris]|eukprot:XP_015660377.1 hypothetical protein ABB37_04171 [Leptomonas pyrrhocoris]
MNSESPVSVLWDSLLKAAHQKPPSPPSFSRQNKLDRSKRRHHRQRPRSMVRMSVYACKGQQERTFWCAEPCRPEKVQIKKKVKKVTFSPLVTVVEFTVTSSRWD